MAVSVSVLLTSSSVGAARTAPVRVVATYVSVSRSLTASGHAAPIRSLVSAATATATAGTDSAQAALSRTATVYVPLGATRASSLLTSRATRAASWSASISAEIAAAHAATRLTGTAHPGLLFLHIQLLTVRGVIREEQRLQTKLDELLT